MTEVSALQEANTLSPTLSTEFGSVREVIGHLSNALSPILFMDFGNVTEVSLPQHENAQVQMLSTEFGNVTEVSP